MFKGAYSVSHSDGVYVISQGVGAQYAVPLRVYLM